MPDIEGPYTVTAPLDRLWERYRSLGAAKGSRRTCRADDRQEATL